MWQASITTAAGAEDAVACLLERAFQQPVSVYCDEATGVRTISVHLRRLSGDAAQVRARLRAALRELKQFGLDPRPGRITVKRLPRENWAESWKRHFKPIEIDDALLIKPGWSKRRPRRGQQVIILDPGLSFGTGQHPTTLFCLQQLARARKPAVRQTFLDIGTGSGILAIAAAKLGYSGIEAFDYDPASVRVSRQNVKKNKTQKQVWPTRKDLTRMPAKSSKRYDVICANLVWDLLISEASKICERLKPGGTLIVAGILQRQFADVAKKLQKFGLTKTLSIGNKEWRSGQFVLS